MTCALFAAFSTLCFHYALLCCEFLFWPCLSECCLLLVSVCDTEESSLSSLPILNALLFMGCPVVPACSLCVVLFYFFICLFVWSHCSTLSSSPASLCSPLSTLFVRLALQFPVQLMSFSDHLNFCLHCLEYFFPEFRFQILHFLPFFIRCICVFLGITQTFIANLIKSCSSR